MSYTSDNLDPDGQLEFTLVVHDAGGLNDTVTGNIAIDGTNKITFGVDNYNSPSITTLSGSTAALDDHTILFAP